VSLAPTAPLANASGKVIDDTGRHLDSPLRFEVGLLKLNMDVGDVGARARRVVEVAVLAMHAIEAQPPSLPR
jgi:hypothetical protein